MPTTAVWWIRRDLRLSDNTALTSALAHADQVIPLFILDPSLLQGRFASDKRQAFLFAGLRQLDADLQRRGSRLILRAGRPAEQLAAIVQETGAAAIFAEADYSPYARLRDQEVGALLPLHLVGGSAVHAPERILKPDGTPYVVYTPFSRAWKALPRLTTAALLPAPNTIPTPAAVISLPLPAATATLFPPGETEAQRRLLAFTEGLAPGVLAPARSAPIYSYGDDRNRMDLAGTSQLSPYLRFGMLSARQAVAAADRALAAASPSQSSKGAETWLNELIWREFYIAILYHFPFVLHRPLRAEMEHIPWANEPADFAAWCEGRTGYPVVDAAMRQLSQTGWMHNRARMIVASFLVKDLLIDWRWGERWFMQHLIDGDPAANNGGWQWTAGVGADAAPYFRIFNPIMQGQKFDPDGAYVRQWLPELAALPDRYVHTPWETPAALQRQLGCVIGEEYPAPIIDHHWARERTLAAYARGGAGDPA